MTRPYRLSPEGRAALRYWSPEARAKMSAYRKAACTDPEKNPLAGLTQEQRRVYDTLRRKGCSRDEALEEARRPIPTQRGA